MSWIDKKQQDKNTPVYLFYLYVIIGFALLADRGANDSLNYGALAPHITIIVVGHIIAFIIASFITLSVSQKYLDGSLDKGHQLTNIIWCVLADLFDYQNKSKRLEFWAFFLWIEIMSFSIVVIDYIVFIPSVMEDSFFSFAVIFDLLVLLPLIAVGSRRLNDTGRSGWWQLLILTVVGIIPLIIFWSQDSKLSSKRDATKSINPENISLELEKLSRLFKNGDITEAEYKKAKEKILE